MLSTSSDDGASWLTIVANPGDTAPTDQFMPDVDVDPWGGVNMTWLDRRSDPVGAPLELWGGRSLDGGATVAAETRVSDAPFDPSTDFFGGVFIGHYNAIASHALGSIPCWADCRVGADSEDLFIDAWNTQLTASTHELSAATGGTADRAIAPGPNLGGSTYLVLATFSGTTPPLIVDGVEIALVWDTLTTVSYYGFNGDIFGNTFGLLGPEGSAMATIDTLGPFGPALVGARVDFVALFFDVNGDIVHATAPEWINLVA